MIPISQIHGYKVLILSKDAKCPAALFGDTSTIFRERGGLPSFHWPAFRALMISFYLPLVSPHSLTLYPVLISVMFFPKDLLSFNFMQQLFNSAPECNTLG